MKIAIAQLNYTIGDIDGNASKIIDSINKAKAQRADLVIFAEQAVSGTPAFDLLRKTTFLELCEDALALAGENGRTDADSIRQCYYLIAKKERRPLLLKLPTPVLNYNPSLSVYDGLMGGDEHV